MNHVSVAREMLYGDGS